MVMEDGQWKQNLKQSKMISLPFHCHDCIVQGSGDAPGAQSRIFHASHG